MKLAHLADLHLGFRAYDRTEHGMNRREIDVALAWSRAVDSIITERPDAVLIAGDLFHSVRPTNHAIIALYQGLARIRAALPETRILAVSGNHDRPRTAETIPILGLFRTLDVTMAIDRVERVEPRPGVAVTLVPEGCGEQDWGPDPAATTNILLLHAAVQGVSPGDKGLAADRFSGWDFVCLGDYHVQHEVAPNAWYAGSLDFVSSDPWAEARAGVPKGYLIIEDTPEGPGAQTKRVGARPGFVARPVALEPPRRFVDLPPFDASRMSAAELDLQIARRVDEASIDSAVVRLVVTSVTRELRAAIDHQAIREYKGRALHFQLDLRRDEAAASPVARAHAFRKLDDVVGAFLGERALPPDVDRDEFVRTGMAAFRDDPYSGQEVA